MQPGASLCVETSDPLARLDMAAFCNEAGHQLVKSERLESGGDRFLIIRGGK